MQETWVQSLGWEDPPEKRKATPLQHSDLENFMNCIVCGVTKSWTQLNNFPFQSNQNCMHWHTDEHTYHWNKIQSPEINSYCSYLWAIDFQQGNQDYSMRRNNLFNKWYWDNWITTCKRIKLKLCLIPCIKNNSKWINDLYLRDKIKLWNSNKT